MRLRRIKKLVPKFQALSEEQKKKAQRGFEYARRESAKRRGTEETVRTAALEAREFALAKGITTAEQGDFQKAVNLYHLQKLAKGVKLFSGKKDTMSGYELSLRDIFLPGGALFPFRAIKPKPGLLGIILYPIQGSIRMVLLPFSISSRFVARYIASKQFKKQTKDLEKEVIKNAKGNKGPLAVHMYLAHLDYLEKLPKKEFEQYLEGLGSLTEKEKKELKEMREKEKQKKAA